MFTLGTHEPHFKVLCEYVFAQSSSATACQNCEEGDVAVQHTAVSGQKKVAVKEKKPFIFLEVAILCKYLELEPSTVSARSTSYDSRMISHY